MNLVTGTINLPAIQFGRLRLPGAFAITCLILFAQCVSAQPNVVILLVDDGGFMDFGGYGGEAATPNINRIADEGVRFTNYHTSPLCAPSRAMLLTGLDNHKTGIATIPEVLTDEQKEEPGYAMHFLPGVLTIADYLKQVGYETFMTGKWHLGSGENQLPDAHGFDRSFALDASGADNWEQKSFMPFYEDAPWFEDGEPALLPKDFYSSRFLVDKMIEYLKARDDEKLFFSYIAFQAIHIPIQAPREFTDRYEGVYTDGWHSILQRRFTQAKELGLVPVDAQMPSLHSSLRDWESLSPAEKTHYERSMMVNAGMLESMDHHIGRLVSYLEASGELDNTVFVITSDNGPEFNDPARNAGFRFWMSQNGYDDNIETMGEKGSMAAIGPEWASVGSVPGSLFKFYASEGGTRVPLIIRGPGIKARGFNNSLNFVMDITPTLVDITGAKHEDVMDGRSLLPILRREEGQTYGSDDAVGLEVAGNAALFKGRYKLTRNTLPHGDGKWRLHDVLSDPAETRDLSNVHPELRNTMLADYDTFAKEMNVIALPDDFNVVEQVSTNVINKQIEDKQLSLIIASLVILIILAFAGNFIYRRFQASD